jgi:hypothetical protein
VQHRIVVDEGQTLLLLHVSGLAVADKKLKAQLIRRHFNAAWTEIEEVTPLFDLRAGCDSLHREPESVPSRCPPPPVAPSGDDRRHANGGADNATGSERYANRHDGGREREASRRAHSWRAPVVVGRVNLKGPPQGGARSDSGSA